MLELPQPECRIFDTQLLPPPVMYSPVNITGLRNNIAAHHHNGARTNSGACKDGKNNNEGGIVDSFEELFVLFVVHLLSL
jgi:hypothetical protein